MVKAALTLFVAVAAAQQTAPAGPTATEVATAAIANASTSTACIQAVRSFVGKRQAEVRPPTGMTSDILRQVDQEKNALAARCVAKFEQTTNDADLAGLADLYSEANKPDLAKRALERGLTSKSVSGADRAALLATTVRIILKEPKGDERNAALERYVGELDALPAASSDQTFDAHRAMLGYYRYDDLDGGIIKHATWIIDAAKKFTPEQRQKFGSSVINAYVDMAEAWAGQGMNDEALALLRRAKTEWAGTPRLADYVDPEMARLELVGTPGAPLTAPRWLNLPAGQTTLDLKGSVTLLEFSAHWCVPCKESYPGINRLLQRFGPQGFRVVVATQMYGYFQAERPLTPDVEFERDRTYFAEHGMNVPIAVADSPKAPVRKADGTFEYTREPNDTNYRVGGIPQIHLIDRKGVIRLVMVGYDDANEEKLAKMIAAMLKEK